MADLVEFVVRLRDEATRGLDSLGVSLRRVADMGLEPIARISPTAAGALGGLLDKAGPAGLALSAIAAASGAAVGALASVTLATARAADELQKMSIRTGMTVEALSALRLAASVNNTSLEAVAIGVRHMQQSLDELSRGVGSTVETFSRLGLSWSALRALAPEQQFEQIAQAIAAVRDPTERTALAIQIFGRSATDLLPLLDDLAARGLAGVRAEADALGVTISGETARAAEGFVDQLTRLSAAGRGLMQTLGAALLPAFRALVDLTLEGAKAIIAFEQRTGLLAGTFRAVGAVIATVGQVMQDLIITPLRTLLSLVEGVMSALERLTGGWGRMAAAAGPAGLVITALGAQLGLLPPRLAEATTAAEPAATAIQRIGTSAAQTSQEMGRLHASLQTAITVLQSLGAEFEPVAQRLQVEQLAQSTAQAIEALRTQLQAGTITTEEFGRATHALEGRLAEAQRRGFLPVAESAQAVTQALAQTTVGAQQAAIALREAAIGELWQQWMEGRLTVDALHRGLQALTQELETLHRGSLPAVAGQTAIVTTRFDQAKDSAEAFGEAIADAGQRWLASIQGISRALDNVIASMRAAPATPSGGSRPAARMHQAGPTGLSETTSELGGLLRTIQMIGGDFAHGGVIPGPPGVPRVIRAHGGELVAPPQQMVAVLREALRSEIQVASSPPPPTTITVQIAPGAVQLSGQIIRAERDWDLLVEQLGQAIARRFGG